MKLTLGEDNLVLSFCENKILVLVLENPHTFMRILQQLYSQCNGGEGELVLSKNEVIISMATNVQVIWNPFMTDFNDKKILNKLYQELRDVSEETCLQDIEEIRGAVSRYLSKVGAMIPYSITYAARVDDVALYKLYEVKLENDGADVLQQLIEYIKILSMLCGTKIVIFINLKDYLDEVQLLELYKTAFYYKIYVLLIEATQKDGLEDEKYYILDRDDCLIEF
ncbi:MAG: type II-A CRISPR-associated protein Csn2 [Acetatifactor sp.]|nr:type II-A CRISPR-associated protein Csn2 [Acetatifactor sp.]